LNILGDVVYSSPVVPDGNVFLNTSVFKSGIYVCRLNFNGKILAEEKFDVIH